MMNKAESNYNDLMSYKKYLILKKDCLIIITE